MTKPSPLRPDSDPDFEDPYGFRDYEPALTTAQRRTIAALGADPDALAAKLRRDLRQPPPHGTGGGSKPSSKTRR